MLRVYSVIWEVGERQNLTKLEDWQFWSSVRKGDTVGHLFFFFSSCRGLWYHLPGRPYSWNLLNWEVFQKSHHVSVAVPSVGGSPRVTEQSGFPQGDGQAWLQRWCHQPAHPSAQLARWALPAGLIPFPKDNHWRWTGAPFVLIDTLQKWSQSRGN